MSRAVKALYVNKSNEKYGFVFTLAKYNCVECSYELHIRSEIYTTDDNNRSHLLHYIFAT